MAATILPESWYGRRDLLTLICACVAVVVWIAAAWLALQVPGRALGLAVANYGIVLLVFVTYWSPHMRRDRAHARRVGPPDERELRIQVESQCVGMWVLMGFALAMTWPALLVVQLDVPLDLGGAGWGMLWMQLGLVCALGATCGVRLYRYRA